MKKRIYKKKEQEKEPYIDDIDFHVHKFSRRERPKDRRRVLIVCCFSEFGCETVGSMYCIPRTLQIYPDFYTIVVGWYGREYLYRHLVDEFWEAPEDVQWLRDYCRAFHHKSKNLERMEKNLSKHGQVLPSSFLGGLAVGNICNDCRCFWGDIDDPKKCIKCESENIVTSIFSDVPFYKKQAIRIPKPDPEKMKIAADLLDERPVGIFARARKTYGRNLQPEFYIKLIEMLRSMGYSPIWLGEKCNTLECPVDDVIDMSRAEECRDLELTLAIVSQLEFTVQYWTASTRLAGMMGVPYLLFESPEQIWGKQGQEGIRINLITQGPRKICVSHYLNVFNDNVAGVDLTRKCIEEMNDGNYNDVIGMIDDDESTKILRLNGLARIGEGVE